MAAFGAPSEALAQLGLSSWDPPSERLEDVSDAEKVDAEALFSGDLLFAGSVGRTDFPRGSAKDLLASLRGPCSPWRTTRWCCAVTARTSTVRAERAANPFLQEALRHT